MCSMAIGQNVLLHGAGMSSTYTYIPSVVWANPVANQEAADDFDVSGTISRVVMIADGCFSCAPAALAGVWVRFYAWQNGNPGALQYQAYVPTGSPGLLYNPASLTDIDITLPTPFHATGQHFVSVQAEFVVAGYWSVWVANLGSPSGSPARFRDNLAGAAWGNPQFPVNADLSFELWGQLDNPMPQPTDPCGAWSLLSPAAPLGSSSGVNDLAIVAPNDVWAVGGSFQGLPGNTSTTNVSWHWDGVHWTSIPVPNPAPAPALVNCTLYAVDAAGPNDVYAAGYQTMTIAGGWTGQQIEVVHWNGSQWTVFANTPLPPSSVGGGVSGARVDDLDVRAANDVWFAGFWIEYTPSTSTTTQPGLLMHYDGTNFTQTNVPLVVSGYQGQWFHQIKAISANDVWAIGHRYAQNIPLVPVGAPLVFHWNGSQWSSLTIPIPGTPSIAVDIDGLDANHVWLIGYHNPSPGVGTPFFRLWNGSAWSSLPAPPIVGQLKVFAADDIYVAADGVWHFDGVAWTQVQAFATVSNPSFHAIDGLGPCQLYCAGAQTSIGHGIPLVTRQESGIYWQSDEQHGCMAGSTPGSLNALTPPSLGTTFSIGASDPNHALPQQPGFFFWAVAAAPVSLGGCGVTLPGLGAGGGAGELFLDLSTLVAAFGPDPWAGGANVAVHSLSLPNQPQLLGLVGHTQGVLFAGSQWVLTNGLSFRFGY